MWLWCFSCSGCKKDSPCFLNTVHPLSSPGGLVPNYCPWNTGGNKPKWEYLGSEKIVTPAAVEEGKKVVEV